MAKRTRPNPPTPQQVPSMGMPMPPQPMMQPAGMPVPSHQMVGVTPGLTPQNVAPAGIPQPPTPEQLATVVPMTDDQFWELIDVSEVSDPDDEIEVRYCKATPELAMAFSERNQKNRYLRESLWKEYSRQMLTPVNDSFGVPIPGTTEWKWRLPVIVYMDNLMSVHNGQHTFKAWTEARIKLAEWYGDESRNTLDESKRVYDYRSLGITLDTLDLRFVLISGIDPNCANYIDRARQRSTGDVAFRNRDHIFGQMDYAVLKKGDAKELSEKTVASTQNQEAKDFSTALKIIAFRRWYNGEFIRGGSAGGRKFDVAPFEAAVSEFPGVADSVHHVTMLNKTDPAFRAGRKYINVSVPYLMASHYLATMAFADKRPLIHPHTGKPVLDALGHPRSEYRATAEGRQKANNFLDLVVKGDLTGDMTGRWSYISRVRDALAVDPKDEANYETSGIVKQGTVMFQNSNAGLAAKFHALGHMFRNFYDQTKKFEISKLPQGLVVPVYGDGRGFDLPSMQIPDVSRPAGSDVG